MSTAAAVLNMSSVWEPCKQSEDIPVDTGLLCDISNRYDAISHEVMELHTHEVFKKTKNNFHFPCLKGETKQGQCRHQDPMWGEIKMLPGQTASLSSQQIPKSETSQLTRFCCLMMSHSNYETSSEVMRL